MSETNRNDLTATWAVPWSKSAPNRCRKIRCGIRWTAPASRGSVRPAFRSWKRGAFLMALGAAAMFLFAVLPFMGGAGMAR